MQFVKSADSRSLIGLVTSLFQLGGIGIGPSEILNGADEACLRAKLDHCQSARSVTISARNGLASMY